MVYHPIIGLDDVQCLFMRLITDNTFKATCKPNVHVMNGDSKHAIYHSQLVVLLK